MNLQAEAAPVSSLPSAPRRSIHWNRWSVFFALTGLAVIIPSFFLPAMLVANALEGPRLFSVWTGIKELWKTDHEFLAGLILVFSVCFPLLKFLLSLMCASGTAWLSRRKRGILVYLASWTAKYSMLDVLVIAMLVMLVKVGDYVRCIACRGIYLFCFAIVCSAIAGALLEMGLLRESSAGGHCRKRWKRHLLMVVAGGALAAWGWHTAAVESGGMINNIHMAPLTKRGALKRSVEATFKLQDLTKEGHEFFSQDTLNKLAQFTQTVSTDAGWQKPEAFLRLFNKDGSVLETVHVKDVDFRDDALSVEFPMPHPVSWNELDSMKLISNVVYTRYLNNAVEEENVRTDAETYSLWTREWHGRIYTFELQGPRGGGFVPALAATGVALLVAFTGLSGILAGVRSPAAK
ncbi:MAG TPA: paraquat-inducible protein A [Verrucomicrobiales bacterium]|nr:paraquat-inducible protein A [Verrucomicrobiales bacterium]